MSSTPSAPPPAAPQKSGSGLKIVLWIIGIFVGIVILCVIGVTVLVYVGIHKAKQAGFDPDLMKKNPVYATFKIAANVSPDVDIMSSDDSAGSLTVREKKTGKVETFKFDAEKNTMVVIDANGKTASVHFDPNTHSMVMTDENGKTATITGDGQTGSLSVNGPDGSLKVGTGANKAPSWVPVYPGANPESKMSSESATDQSGMTEFVTQDSVDKILDYYSAAMKSAGMTSSTTTTNAN